MGYRTQNQNFNIPMAYGHNQAEHIASTIRAMGLQRLFKSQGLWYIYDHTGAGAHRLIIGDPAQYTPDFTVRYFKLEGTANQMRYDVPMDTHNGSAGNNRTCIDKYTVEILHPVQITHLYLDENTTCDAITLYY